MRVLAACCAASFASIITEANGSCGAAFCLINTDWSAQGTWVEDGARVDLRYESIDLDQPRAGRDRVAVGQIPRDHDEVETKNRNWVANIDWNAAPGWGLSLAIPHVDRDHFHIHNHQGGREPETWHFRELGDVRVEARHEIFASRDDPSRIRSAGMIVGMKLPTGKFDVRNADGEEAERTLQPGTGTIDLILGAYWYSGNPLADTSWFARMQTVLPLDSRADYKPGRQLSVDVGYRYGAIRDVGLMLQLNYHVKDRDSGANAEPEDSGQRQLFVSPGVSWNASSEAQVYAFVQLPLYQSVNGVQLTAKWSALAGVSWRF